MITAATFIVTASPSGLFLLSGQSGTITLDVSGPDSSSATVQCTATTITCQVGPPTVAPNLGTTFTLTIGTSTTAANHSPWSRQNERLLATLFDAPVAILLLPGIPGMRRKRRTKRGLLLCAAFTTLLIALAGCGGGGGNMNNSNNNNSNNKGVPAGTYTASVSVSAANGSVTGATNISIIVN